MFVFDNVPGGWDQGRIKSNIFLLKIVEFCITYLISGWVDCSSAFSVHKFWWQIFYIQCFKILGIAEQLTRIKCINLTDRYVEAVNSILFCSDLFVQLSYYATFITMQARNQGGGHLGHSPPQIFKILYSNFEICGNFQIIKLKVCILIIFKKSLTGIFLCLTHLPTRCILRQAFWWKIS